MLKTLTPRQSLTWQGLHGRKVNLYGRGGEVLRESRVMRFGELGEQVRDRTWAGSGTAPEIRLGERWDFAGPGRPGSRNCTRIRVQSADTPEVRVFGMLSFASF